MKTFFIGRWRIVQMEQWDQDYVDMVAPGHIAFKKDGTGQLHFGCVETELDWRFEAGWTYLSPDEALNLRQGGVSSPVLDAVLMG
jgi:hypothetical protein